MNTVPGKNLYAMLFTLIISFLLPIALWIIFRRKDKRLSSAVIAGAIGFIIPQFIIRIPILQKLSANEQWISFAINNKILHIALLAVTTALFETAGRLLVFKGILRKRLSYNAALGAGIGHGGAESIGLIGVTYLNNVILSFMINSGTAPYIKNALIDTPASTFLAAGIERVFTIPFHIALSVLLCLFITKGKTVLGTFICIAIHFSIDFIISTLFAYFELSLWTVEGIIFIVAAASIFLIIKLKNLYTDIEIPKDPAEKALEQGY